MFDDDDEVSCWAFIVGLDELTGMASVVGCVCASRRGVLSVVVAAVPTVAASVVEAAVRRVADDE